MIEVSDISKTFETRKKRAKALKSVSFSAFPGQIYGLIGPNGAGKTTALRTIATLLKPDTGFVKVNGFDSQQNARSVRDTIGFLTSDMKLSGNLSARELLRFFGRLNHLEEQMIEKRIDIISSYLEMKEFLDKSIVKLSTGMKQKAQIAVSIVHDPEVIIFDEPTAGLDILASKIVIDFLKDSRKNGKTVLLSTHMLNDAGRMCDSVGILVEGKLLVNGRLDDVLKQHNADSLEDVFFSVHAQKETIK